MKCSYNNRQVHVQIDSNSSPVYIGIKGKKDIKKKQKGKRNPIRTFYTPVSKYFHSACANLRDPIR